MVKDKILNFTHYENIKTGFLSIESSCLMMMRLHFLVHTFINLYVRDPVEKTEYVGYRKKERTEASV